MLTVYTVKSISPNLIDIYYGFVVTLPFKYNCRGNELFKKKKFLASTVGICLELKGCSVYNSEGCKGFIFEFRDDNKFPSFYSKKNIIRQFISTIIRNFKHAFGEEDCNELCLKMIQALEEHQQVFELEIKNLFIKSIVENLDDEQKLLYEVSKL